MFKAVSCLLLAGFACECGGKVGRDASATGDLANGDLATELAPVNAQSSACARLPQRAPSARPETGAELWLRQLDSSPAVSGTAIDAAGNLLVSRAEDRTDAFDANGRELWSQPFGTLVSADELGNVYIAGPLEAEVTIGDQRLGPADGVAYVAKLGATGVPEYARALGGSGDAGLLGLAVSESKSSTLAVSGSGFGTVAFDADGRELWRDEHSGRLAFDACGNALLAGADAGNELFVRKLGARGEPLFFRQFPSVRYNQRLAIAVDQRGDVIVGGVFDAWLDYGDGQLTLDDAACSQEAWCELSGFLLELDAFGSVRWARALGPMRAVSSMVSDARGHIVVSGTLPGGVTPFEIPLLLKLDASGAPIWRRSEWPASGIGDGHDVMLDSSDNVLWSVSALLAPGGDERPFIAELSP